MLMRHLEYSCTLRGEAKTAAVFQQMPFASVSATVKRAVAVAGWEMFSLALCHPIRT